MLVAAVVMAALAFPAVPEKPRLVVLELRNDGVTPANARALLEALTAELAAAAPQIDVAAIDEMRGQLALAGNKKAASCTDDSCVGDVAQILGASYVVLGDVGMRGTRFVAHVTLRDPSGVIATELLDVGEGDDLRHDVRHAAKKLVASLPGAPPKGPPLTLIGGLAAGGGAIVAAAGGAVALWGTTVVTNLTPVASGGPDGDAKLQAREIGQIAVVAAAAGGLVVVGGGIACAMGLAE